MVTADRISSQELMRAFFAPAETLMNRLNIARKFALLGLMLLVAIGVVVYSLFASLGAAINFSQQQLKGLELIRPFPHAIQVLQEHRGLSAGLLGGDETVRDIRASTEKEVVEALDGVLGTQLSGMASSESRQYIKTEWERLRSEGLNWTVDENFAAHTRLIERIWTLEVDVSDEYSLILDPEFNTYYLIDTIVNKLPFAIERLGQLRAHGTGMLAEKRITAQQQTEMNILLAEFKDNIGTIKVNLDKIGRHSPALQGVISVAFDNIADSGRQMTSLVKADIFDGSRDNSPEDFFWMSTAAIDQNYAQLHESLLPMAETLIEARIARAKNTLHASVGIALLLFLVAAYFSIGVCRTIIVNIRSLASSAHAFAGGDLHERVNLNARDEFRQVGDSFNKMAGRLKTLLETSRESEARLHDLSVHLEDRVKERTAELAWAQHETESLLRRNQALMETSMDGIYVLDMQGSLVAANDAFCRILGYTQQEVLGLNAADWNAQWTVDELRAKFSELIGGSAPFETVWRRKDSTLLNVEISASGVELEGQKLIFASSRDITARKQAESMPRQHKVIIDTAIDGFWMADAMGNLREVNMAYAEMSGYSIDELVKMHISDLEAKEQSIEDVLAHAAKIIAQGYDRFETRHRRKDGHEIDIEVSATFHAESQQFFGFCRDISERKRVEEEIHCLAFYDALTKLANRRLFLDRFQAALPVSARHNSYGAVLFIDMDKLKALNDTLGHDYGDLLLVEVAIRIKACVREMDTAARLGGDEFVVLIEEISDNREEAARKVGLVAEKIREALARPYHLNGHEHHSSPSIGVCLYRGNEETVDTLLKYADMAMYHAKNSGRNAVRFFDAAMQHDEAAHTGRADDLRRADREV